MSEEYKYNYQYDHPQSHGLQNKPQPPKKGEEDWVSWLLIGIFFLTGLWPVGLIMLIAKLSDGSGKKKTPAKAGTAQTGVRRDNAGKKRGRTSHFSAKGAKAMRVIGLIWAFLSLMIGLDELSGIEVFTLWRVVRTMAMPFSSFIGGMGLFIGGMTMQQRSRRFGKYLTCAGARQAIDINELAKAADVTEVKAEKDCEIMVEKGLWGTDAYVDNGRDMLFLSRQAAEAYLAQHDTPAVPKQTEEGNSGILRNIRRVNDRIADPVLSEKIDRLEQVAGKIFKCIENDPQKQQRASTFLNYYLPTTQKLLDSYADFEETGISGENLNEAKRRIAATMDSIVQGFEHQLDDLYQTEAMDIDSEVRVMESMLRRDTASAARDFGLAGGAAAQTADTKHGSP